MFQWVNAKGWVMAIGTINAYAEIAAYPWNIAIHDGLSLLLGILSCTAWALFGTPSDLSHTGRVISFDDDYIYTIEGNTNDSGSREGDGVYAKKHGRREARVIGYGYPRFPEGIVSADPKWSSQKPIPAPRPPADPPTPPSSSGLIAQLRRRIANQKKKIANLRRRAAR